MSLRLRLQDPIFKTKWEIYDSTQADADRSLEFEATLVYKVSSRPAKAT